MKDRVRLLIATLIFVPTLILVPMVSANEGTDDSTSMTSNAQYEQLTEEQKAAIKGKLSEIRDKIKPDLSELEKKALKFRCVPAQKIVEKLSTRMNAKVPQRVKAYNNLDNLLAKLIDKLKAGGIDTANLESLQNELQAKISTYRADLELYNQALDEAAAGDCETDTEAFKADLEAARTAHKTVIEDIAEIKTYVKETVRPAIVQVRQSIAKDNNENTNE